MLYVIIGLVVVAVGGYYYLINQFKKQRIHISFENHDYSIKKNIAYKEVEGRKLEMDIYIPKSTATGTVILVHGEGPDYLIKDCKDWGFYVSYAELLVSNGFSVITFNHRSSNNFKTPEVPYGDILDAIQFVADNQQAWGLGNSYCLWAFSSGVPYTFSLTQKETIPIDIQCIVTSYGYMDLSLVDSSIDRSFSPETWLMMLDTPLLIVKAEADSTKGINQSIDRYTNKSIANNRPVDVITHETGVHGFEVRSRNDRTKEVIESSIQFVKANMNRSKFVISDN